MVIGSFFIFYSIFVKFTGSNKILDMRITYSINKVTHTFTIHNNLLFYYGKNGFTKEPQCYVIRAFPVLFLSVNYFDGETFIFMSMTICLLSAAHSL
jgi:hypothetical protein